MQPSRVLVVAAICAVIVVPVGCARQPVEPTTGCAESVDSAAEAIEVDDQKRFLDDALLQCRSTDALAAELDRHPGLIGYDAEQFVAIRCARVDDPVTRSGPTCASVAPATTETPTTVVDIVFVGDTLDGRRVEIRPGDTIRFVGDVPEVVQQTVDIAFESGCDGLVEQSEVWAARVDDSRSGDVASVYAQHARNVAAYIGCDVPAVPE